MASHRTVLRRNRGLAIALALVSVVLLGYASFPALGPRVSWKEHYTPRDKDEELGDDFYDDGGEFLISPDGRLTLTIFREQAKVRDLTTGRVAELKFNPPGPSPRLQMDDASFLDGGRLVVGLISDPDQPDESPDALKVKVYEVPSGRERIAVGGIEGNSEGRPFAISRDGSTLAYAMGKPGPPTIGVWNALEDRPPAYFAGMGPFALSDDGRALALIESTGSEARIVVWEVASARRLASIAVAGPSNPVKIAFSPDGKTLAESWRDEVIQDRGIEEERWKEKIILRDVAASSIKRVLSSDLMDSDSFILNGGELRFSPDGSLLFLEAPIFEGMRSFEVWDLAVNPPRFVFQGAYQDLSRDGHRMVQSGPNFVTEPEKGGLGTSSDPCRVVELPSMKPVERELASRSSRYTHITLNPEGRLAAIGTSHVVLSWSQRLLAWLPPRLRPTSPKFKAFRLQYEVQVIDLDSGDRLRTVNSIDREGFVEEGKTLISQRWTRSKAPSASGYDEEVELWDAPGPSSKWPTLGLLAVVALGSGRWYDVRAHRRLNLSPAPA